MGRMSQTEAMMWTLDKDPELRSDFTNVTILEEFPDEERVRAKAAEAVRMIPRLAQRVVSPPLRIAPPEWCDDPTIDLDYHFRTVAVPSPGGMRQLLDLVAILSSMPFDRSRPLWEFTLVEGLEGGRAAILQQVHHTIMDGVGGVELSLALLDFEPDPPPPPEPLVPPSEPDADPLERSSPVDTLASAIADAIRSNVGLAKDGLTAAAHLAMHPGEIPDRAHEMLELAASMRRQALVTDTAHSPLLAHRSLRRRYETFQVPLSEAKAAAKRLGGSINDFYIAGLGGALGIYHEQMGTPVEDLRLAMPVNLRGKDGGDGMNHFAPARIVVAVEPKDPVERFRSVRTQLGSVRDEPALTKAGELSKFLQPVPTSLLVSFTRAQARTIDFAASNLRGSPVPLYLAGSRIEANFPMGPRSGVPLNVTLMSYCDSLDMGLNIDPVAISDVDALMRAMDESFDSLLHADA